MQLARVVGTVVASQKEEVLEGLRFLVLRPVDDKGKPSGTAIVGADAVGAGVGEMVMYCSGSAARQTLVTKNRPVDAVVMAIVDEIFVDGKQHYSKSDD